MSTAFTLIGLTAPAKTKQVRTSDVPLTTDEAKAAARVARPAVTPCLCGCGGTTKGRFVPGHDAVLKARLAATSRAGGAAGRHADEALATYGWDAAPVAS